MSDINILHLSDLHYDASKEKDTKIVLNALWNDLEKLKKEENLQPDLVTFSGDLVQAADFAEQYNTVKDIFIDPLLTKLKLDYSHFFIAPGNHDVQRGNIDEYYEAGLTVKLTESKHVNAFLDSSKNSTYFNRFINFNNFKQKIDSQYKTNSDHLYSSYNIPLKGHNIGIVCLNSAWRATGKGDEFDNGHLIVGERQLFDSVNDLKGAEIKIAILHHPFSCLVKFEKTDLKRKTLRSFDMVLFGHNHDPESELIYNAYNKTIISNCGCLYENREYYNGYSLINYNLEKKQVVVHLRTYFDQRGAFDNALNYVEKGKAHYFLNDGKEENLAITNPTMIDAYAALVVAQSNDKLLSATNDSSAPKDIREIFVEPQLANKSKDHTLVKSANIEEIYKKEKNQTSFLTVKQLITSSNNYLFMGAKESGKTTLLHYICISSLDQGDISAIKLPFYVNYKELPKGSKPIHKAMLNFITGIYSSINIEDQLKNGNCLLLFDDFDFSAGKSFERLHEFISLYPNNRYFFVMNEDLFQNVELSQPPDIGIQYDKIYIHPFSRKEIKSLATKWYRNVSIDLDDVLDKVTETIFKINVPVNPPIVSLMLWIFEKQGNYVPLNKAALIERFIDIVMDKLNISEIRYDALDYRNKEHYLSFIAFRMVEKNEYYFNRLNLEKETLQYFENKGMETSISVLIDYFIKNGIFLVINNNVTFKYKCFCEYFIAKKMIEDNNFYHDIIKEETYLSFSNELDYMTGLQRNNRELLSLLSDRLDQSLAIMDIDIKLSDFKEMEIQKSLFDDDESKESFKKFKEFRLDEEERDDLLDIPYCDCKQDMKRVSFLDHKDKFLYNLILFSKVIKNCEFIDDLSFKRRVFKKCMSYWSLFLLITIMVGEEIFKTEIQKQVMTDEITEELRQQLKTHEDELNNLLKVMLPLMIQSMIHTTVGSEKLKPIISLEIDDTSNEELQFLLCTMLYADLKLPDYLNKIKNLINKTDTHKYLFEIVLYKLMIYYMFRRLPENSRKEMENLMGDIYVCTRTSNISMLIKGPKESHKITTPNRNKFIKDMRDKFLRRPLSIKDNLVDI
jgi:3',5'-cyclic AMP phosphodiesterase CpdA